MTDPVQRFLDSPPEILDPELKALDSVLRDIARKAIEQRDELVPDGYPRDLIGMAIARYNAELAALLPPCDHQWIDVRNEVVLSGEMCITCGAIRAGNEATS